MNRYRILAITFLLLVALTPTASARFATPEGPNAGINIGNTVFLGEQRVNFSEFSDGDKSPTRMVRIDSGQPIDSIILTNGVANYIRGSPGLYYPYYNNTTIDHSRSCWIQDASSSLGRMMVNISGTNAVPQTNPDRPATIPYRMMEVQFLLPEHTLPLSEFQGPWYEYELQGNVKTDSIVNTAGTRVSLRDLSADPAALDSTYAFHLSDQHTISRDRQVTMVFRMTLNGLNHELSYPFTAKDYQPGLELSALSVERGDTLILTVQGTPFIYYNITLPVPLAGEDYPRFADDRRYQKVSDSDYYVRAYPGWDGVAQLQIDIPEEAPLTSYRVSATGPDAVLMTATFDVIKKAVKLVFNDPGGQYIIGDNIRLSGSLSNIRSSRSDLIPIYLFVTGPNLPANGAPLVYPGQGVVDDEPGSFTIAYYNPATGRWEYDWETRNFQCDEGTYTVHANIHPIGYQKSCYPGAPGSIDGVVPPSWECALIGPTAHAKFDETTGGVFARGDYLYSWWYARGNPGGEGATSSTGHMKWYIFGPNFKYADCNPRFPLGGDSGTYGITYLRNFTYELSPGDYFLVYHHPGRNNRFDVLPENDLYFKGNLKRLFKVNDGKILVDFGNLDSEKAANALVKALDSVNIDDTYVMDTFTIEDPMIRIEPPGELVVGDGLVVEGTTNLAGGGTTPDGTSVADTLTLTITSLDMHESGKANTVMTIPFDRTTPGGYNRITGLRSFSYGSIDTSTWYPGKYMVTVWCKDVDHKETCTFELLAEGSERTTADSEAENPFPYRTPAPPTPTTPTVAPDFTPIPLPTTQSPGFEVFLAITALFGALFLRRR